MQKFGFLFVMVLSSIWLAAQEKQVMPVTDPMSPVAVVQRQLDAYNARDIDAFVATFADTVKVYNSAGKLTMNGEAQLRRSYENLFKSTPNLYCLLENRIVINNKVIDQEKVTMGERIIHAVAVYDVEGGKITKVRFID